MSWFSDLWKRLWNGTDIAGNTIDIPVTGHTITNVGKKVWESAGEGLKQAEENDYKKREEIKQKLEETFNNNEPLVNFNESEQEIEQSQPQTEALPTEPPEIDGEKVGENGIDPKPNDEAQRNSMQMLIDYMKKAQQHVDEREDSAYQRAILDMRKAGINPMLLGSISPAESKGVTGNIIGGLSQLTTANINNIADRIIQMMQQEFTMSENQKDRTLEYIKMAVMAGSNIMSSLLR